MSHRTTCRGEWREYPGGLKIFFLNPPETPMDEMPVADLAYITFVAPEEPILNFQVGGRFFRMRLNRDQILGLNQDIADLLIRGHHRRLPDGQLDLSLDTQH